ncbi:acyltransferase domain-containing protein, partial [Cellulomonas oligotrophica]|uniref:acyltransferase domain-containing protein n=1 Tax=Cellulomonas oligotrophica TaxID=931536 RepID=UPI0031E5D8F8
MIIEQAPAAVEAAGGSVAGPVPWVLSAKDAEALRAQARRLLSFVGDQDVVDVGRSLATTRATLEHRAVVAGASSAELIESLTALASGTGLSGTPENPGKVAFVFSGQGSQREGMGRELYEAFPVYASAFDAVCAHLEAHLDRPIRDVIFDGEGLDETGYTQPALFAVEVALYRLAESFGVRPDYLVGHSI